MKLKITILFFFYSLCITIAQVRYLGEIITIDGIQLFQAADDENAYYFLPKSPRLALNKDSMLQVSLLKYKGIHQDISGGLFSATIEYNLDKEEIAHVEKQLKRKNKKAFLKGQLPLFTFKNDPRYGNTSFKLVSSSFTPDNKTSTHKVITSGHAPLQPGSKAAIMLELSKEGASLLEQSLLQGTSDLSVLMTAYYPAITPTFFAKISVPAKETERAFQKKFKQSAIKPQNIRQFVQSMHTDNQLNIEISDGLEDAKSSQQMAQIIQLFTEQVIDRLFEPVIGNCSDQEGSEACLQLKANPRLIGDSIQITLQRNSIVKVPIILAGNIGGFIKNEQDRAKYIKVIHLSKDFIGDKRSVDFKINEDFLEAFESCLKGVSVKVKNSTSTRPFEFSFNWSEIKNGQYVKQLKLRFQDQQDTLYYYQTAWDFANADTILVSPWKASTKPFISLTPPLEKHIIDLAFKGNKEEGIKKIIVEFGAKLGQGKKGRVIDKIELDNPEGFNMKSLTLFTDPGSYIRYRSRWYIDNKAEKKQQSKLLADDNLIWLSLNEN